MKPSLAYRATALDFAPSRFMRINNSLTCRIAIRLDHGYSDQLAAEFTCMPLVGQGGPAGFVALVKWRRRVKEECADTARRRIMRRTVPACREPCGLPRTPAHRSFQRGLHPIPAYFIIDLRSESIACTLRTGKPRETATNEEEILIMGVSSSRARVADLAFQVFNRALHPDWFSTRVYRRIPAGEVGSRHPDHRGWPRHDLRLRVRSA